MLTPSLYVFVVFVHVTAATLLIGQSIIQFQIRGALASAASLEALREWLTFGRRSAQFTPLLALLVLTTGVYLGSFGWWTQPWFHVAVIAWLINSVLAATVVKPAVASLSAETARTMGHAITPALDGIRLSNRWTAAGTAMRASDLAMIYLMLAKPGLLESCLVLSGTVLTLVLVDLSRQRQRRRSAAPPAQLASA